MPYYSPRTGTETEASIGYVSELSSTAYEVRKKLADEEVSLKFPETATTLWTLLTDVMLNPDIPVSQILSMRAPRNVDAPKLFENMWTILFSLGVVPGFENIEMHEGKVDIGTRKLTRSEVLAMLKKQNIGTSSASGASDITFEMAEKRDGVSQMVFCTSKYFKQEKSVDKFDIQNIIASAEASPDRKKFDYRVLVLTNNRDVAEEIFSRALRRYITYLAKDGILGRVDLEAAVTRLRERVIGHESPEKFIQSTFFNDLPPRPFLELRFHQELIVEKTLDLISSGKSTALWGVVARGGKTYMCAGLIRALLPKITSVFIVLGAYTETAKQFTRDLLKTSEKGFEDFKDVEVIDVKKDTFNYDKKKKYIFIMSSELLKVEKKKVVEGKKERRVMDLLAKGDLTPELVFFDEVHKGGTTELATRAAELFSKEHFSVYMTATYIKALLNSEFSIGTENLISWGYEDIQKAKSITVQETLEYFEKKYGKELCQRVVSSQNSRGNSLSVIQKQYERFPDIQFLNTDFSPEFIESMTSQNMIEPSRGFSMAALLATTKDCEETSFEKRWECFLNPGAVATFLNYMGPASSQMAKIGTRVVPKLAASSEHIMTRIGLSSQVTRDVLKNVDTDFVPHSQLWFLPMPSGAGLGNLNAILTCTASMILQHPWFRKHFSVVCVASSFDPRKNAEYVYDRTGVVKFLNADNVKDEILKLEENARENSRGVIILAGGMLTLGVSLPNVNVVGLLDDSESPDLTYQKMFRALTENTGKKTGYVVDMNPLRTINTLYTYTVAEKERFAPVEAREHVDAIALTQLYLINEDQFLTTSTGNRITPTAIHEKIQEYIDKVASSFKDIKTEVMSNIATVNLDDEFKEIKEALIASKPETVSVRVGEEDRDVPDVPTGIEHVKPPAAPKAEPSPEKGPSDAELRMSLNESIQTATIILGVLTDAKTYDEATKFYTENRNNIQDVVYDKIMEQGLFDEEKSKYLPLREILARGLSKARDTQAVTYRKMVKRMEKAGGDQREVLDIMVQELKPKKAAKDKRGEVFTPPTLVEDMLNHIPDEVWTNPDLKWLDPANGIGNFPIIAFAKLDVALKEKIPDDNKRKKHIIENMLYMTEITASNNAIARNLFGKMCGDPECKLNILEANFLTSDVSTTFGVPKFDVIMGNPPYNAGGVNKGGGTLWPKFVKRAFELVNDGGYITFVHPPGWRKFYDAEDRENQGKLWYTIRNNDWSLLYINISDKPRFIDTNVITDYYVIQKTAQKDKTEYKTTSLGIEASGSTELDLPFIPNIVTETSVSIIKRLLAAQGIPIKIVYNQSFKPTPKDKDAKGVPHYHFTTKTGEQMIYYKEYDDVPEYIAHPKVFMTMKAGHERGRLFAFYSDAVMGTTNNSMYMLVSSKEEGEKVANYLNSDVVTFVMKITQYSEPPNHINEYKILNQLNVPESLQLTDTEKELVGKIVKPSKGGERRLTRRRKKSPNTTLRNPATYDE